MDRFVTFACDMYVAIVPTNLQSSPTENLV